MKPARPTAQPSPSVTPPGTFVYRDGAWYLLPTPRPVKK